MMIATVLVNFNTEEEIKGTYSSLSSTTDIYVVDNSPSSEFEQWCSDNGVEYFRSPENTGYAGGNNIAIRRIHDRYDYVLVLNPDIDVGDGTPIDRLLEVMESSKDIAILGPTVRYTDETKQNYPPHPVPTLFRKFGLLPELGTPSNNDLLFTDSIKGCAMMIDTDVFDDIGFFDERFFMYREETEFCYRARLHGHTVAIATDVSVYHPDTKGLNHDTPLQMYYDIRNRFHLANTCFDGVDLIPAYVITLASVMMQVLRIIQNGNISLLKPLFLGFLDGIQKRSGKTRYVAD